MHKIIRKSVSLLLLAAFLFALSACAMQSSEGIKVGGLNLQSIFSDGFYLDTLIGKHVIKADALLIEPCANCLYAYDDKLEFTFDTSNIRKQMDLDNITVDAIQKERQNADTAGMDYVLQYQYCLTMQIGDASYQIPATVDVSEETLGKTVKMTVPIASEKIGETLYGLLQGKAITVEECLQHGTDYSTVIKNKYYLGEAAPIAMDFL